MNLAIADPNHSIVGWCAGLSFLLIGIYVGVVAFELELGLAFFLAYLITPVLLVAATVFHELGHALAAWAMGWRVHAINVAGLTYCPVRKRFRFEPKARYDDVGGFVFSTTNDITNWAKEYKRIVFSGPAANLIVAIVFGVISQLSIGNGKAVFWGFAATNLIMAIFNLWPALLSGGRSNDGHMMWRITKGYQILPYEHTHAMIAGMGYDGVHHTKWQEHLAAADSFASLNETEVADVYRDLYHLAFSQGDVEVAYRIWREHLDGGVISDAPSVLSFALCIVLSGHGTIEARDILSKIERTSDVVAFNWWRTMVAIEIDENNFTLAAVAAYSAERAAVLAGSKPDKDDKALFSAARSGTKLAWPVHKPHN